MRWARPTPGARGGRERGVRSRERERELGEGKGGEKTRTQRGRPHGVLHSQDRAVEVLAAVLDDGPSRRGVDDRRVQRLHVPEAVLRRELLRALHVECPALHAHVAVRLDDGPPALLLAPLRDLGEGAAVRVGHVGRVRLRLRARVVEEGDEIDLKTLYILGRKRGDRCARASLSRFTTSTQKEWDDAI